MVIIFKTAQAEAITSTNDIDKIRPKWQFNRETVIFVVACWKGSMKQSFQKFEFKLFQKLKLGLMGIFIWKYIRKIMYDGFKSLNSI